MTADSFASIYDRLRAEVLAGKTVRIIDIPRDQRAAAIAALAMLRDELPVRMSWRTVSESHLSETRLRARCYWIAGEHLPELREGAR